MSSFTDILEPDILKVFFTGTARSTTGTGSYVSLHSTSSSESAMGTELSVSGYARQSVTWTLSGSTISNSADITFGPFSSGATVVSVGIYNAATAGTPFAYVNLATSKSVGAGESIRIPAGQLTITMD